MFNAARSEVLMLLLLLACTGGDAPGGGGGGGGGGGDDTGAAWWEAPAGDADGDGVTAAGGDCDDGDPARHPDVTTDACGGGDEDCDGEVDEDFAGDPYEPDDAGFEVGWMDEADVELVWPYLFPETDVDRFRFTVEDGDWSWFSVELWLYDVPGDADYTLELYWVVDPDGQDRGLVAQADDWGPGGYEELDWGGEAGEDDSGTYEAVVRSLGGARCDAPYALQILTGGW